MATTTTPATESKKLTKELILQLYATASPFKTDAQFCALYNVVKSNLDDWRNGKNPNPSPEGALLELFKDIMSGKFGSEIPAELLENKKEIEARLAKKDAKKGGKAKKGTIEVDPISGTRDFTGADMRFQRWLFNKFHQVAKNFSFEEYEAPILEPVQLYERKGGEEIKEQIYNFEDKSGAEVSLRPEMTPTLARLILKEWNMDIWGVSQVTAEAELLAAIVEFFKLVKLDKEKVSIRISSRKVLQHILTKVVGIPEAKFLEACIVVDKLDKIREHMEVVYIEFDKIGFDRPLTDKILKTLDSVKTLEDLAAMLGEQADPVVELRNLFKYAEGYGFADYLVFDVTIVRGLAYYTGIVFEGFARVGDLKRAICGGGRYDKILSIYGSKKDIPAAGFGFGDCVIKEILTDLNLMPDLPRGIDDVVIPFDEKLRPAACQVAMKLRQSGRVVDIILKTKSKVTDAFEYADRHGADRVIFVAPSEWEKGMVRVKYMRGHVDPKTAEQYDVKLEDLATFVRPTKSE